MIIDLLRSKQWSLVSGMLLLIVACSQTVQEPVPSPTETPAASNLLTPTQTAEPDSVSSPRLVNRTPAEPPPVLDRTIASVPLEKIYFDTFNGGSIRLSDASDGEIDRLRDRIKPVYEPKYESVEGGDWLSDDDMVIGYVSERGEAFAYPIRILNFHEFVNDVIDGVPVLISYCPLCASGVVYDRRLGDDILVFGNTSALFESDAVMFDHNTGSYWFQVLGEAIVGTLTGKRLTPLPSSTTTWGQWKDIHPDTKILSRDLGLLPENPFDSPYDRNPFLGYDQRVNAGHFAFPVDEDKLDNRLRYGDRVFTVLVGDVHKAYPLTDQPDQAINDQVNGENVVIMVREEGPSGVGFLSTFDGQTLTFSLNGGVLQDAETSSRWDDSGRAISGPLAGSALTPLPSRTSFWFSIVGSLPDVELYTP